MVLVRPASGAAPARRAVALPAAANVRRGPGRCVLPANRGSVPRVAEEKTKKPGTGPGRLSFDSAPMRATAYPARCGSSGRRARDVIPAAARALVRMTGWMDGYGVMAMRSTICASSHTRCTGAMGTSFAQPAQGAVANDHWRARDPAQGEAAPTKSYSAGAMVIRTLRRSPGSYGTRDMYTSPWNRYSTS